ncbi:membrane protein insertion efficiency factor YidD [Candidatus Saccharibacteria bacterium]|nr:membrane protein insertion efficiency factor YidD [Candidatus Saccharibacteria bacterium]
MKKTIVYIINIYQKTLSPDHSWRASRYPHGFCRHYPSCSEYTKRAVENHGVLKGLCLAVVRVVSCNPFAQPKIDLSCEKVLKNG